MAPTDSPDFDHTAVAWARLCYEESEGTFKGRLEVSPDMSRIMMSGPSTVDSKEDNLWSEKWNEVMWGQQLLLDQMDHTAYATARAEAKGTGKGTNFGVGWRHWSNTLLHNSYFSPYPFELELVQVEAVAGDLKVCNFGGKPAPPPCANRADGCGPSLGQLDHSA